MPKLQLKRKGAGKGLQKDTGERLVELVRQNPCLYDVTMSDYKDSQMAQNIWDSISVALGKPNMDGKNAF
jgi:hypothetical protein